MRHGKIQAGVLATAIAALVLPAAAQARPPQITNPPELSGDAVVGKTLTAVDYEYTGGRRTHVAWQWRRCPTIDTDVRDCAEIDDTDSPSYAVSARDEGTYLRVMLIVWNEDGLKWAASAPSAKVPGPPTPPPEPSATPTPEPATSPQPETVPPGGTPIALAPTFPSGVVLEKKPRMMRPAPIVRIRGRTTAGGARITLLTVKAPRGARISVRCRGRSCPAKKWAHATKLTRLLKFQRVLAAGTRLTIRVTKPGRIGKYTQIVIREGKAPTRRDRCLKPGSSKPRRCPSV